jgi:hypothetical protein
MLGPFILTLPVAVDFGHKSTRFSPRRVLEQGPADEEAKIFRSLKTPDGMHPGRTRPVCVLHGRLLPRMMSAFSAAKSSFALSGSFAKAFVASPGSVRRFLARPATIPRARAAETRQKAISYHSQSSQ